MDGMNHGSEEQIQKRYQGNWRDLQTHKKGLIRTEAEALESYRNFEIFKILPTYFYRAKESCLRLILSYRWEE